MEEMMITNVTRSAITGVYDGKLISVEGEAYHRGYGSPDFVAYSSTLVMKDTDGNVLRFDEGERVLVLDALARAMHAREQTIEFEQ